MVPQKGPWLGPGRCRENPDRACELYVDVQKSESCSHSVVSDSSGTRQRTLLLVGSLPVLCMRKSEAPGVGVGVTSSCLEGG